MIRYFISYEDLIENNKINKKIDFDSEDLYVIKKNKKGYYTFNPILYFKEYKSDLIGYSRTLNYNKKGILLVELTSEEASKLEPILIKKYEYVRDNKYKKYFEKDNKPIKLINYNSVIHMKDYEIKHGEIVAVMPCKSKSEYMYISCDRNNSQNHYGLNTRRNMLHEMNIGCDLYFYTENEELLEKYRDDLTILKEIDYHTYDITYNKIYVIDSLSQRELDSFNGLCFKYLYDIMKSSQVVSIKNKSNGYKLDIKNIDKYEKKGYILHYDKLHILFINDSLMPLLKHINVYEFKDGLYYKTSLIEYLKEKNTLKYIKKPNN